MFSRHAFMHFNHHVSPNFNSAFPTTTPVNKCTNNTLCHLNTHFWWAKLVLNCHKCVSQSVDHNLNHGQYEAQQPSSLYCWSWECCWNSTLTLILKLKLTLECWLRKCEARHASWHNLLLEESMRNIVAGHLGELKLVLLMSDIEVELDERAQMR